MTTLDIPELRLRNQRLVGNHLETAEEVVRWFGAVQAQDYPGAKWGLAQRLPGATNGQLDQLFNAGEILRTHVLRPTWHFVLPEDIRWMLELTGPRVNAAVGSYYRKNGVDEAVVGRSQALMTEALAGGTYLTRPEIGKALAAGGIVGDNLRLSFIVMRAELDGLICSGPLRGKQHTYALIEERAPAARRLTREEALAELTRRYFVSHGPATAQDFGWWSGLTVADAKLGIELVGDVLRRETVEGKAYWIGTDVPAPGGQRRPVHLLPNYDEHLVAYKDHGPSLHPRMPRDLAPDHPVWMGHFVALDGLVAGGWRRTVGKRDVTVTPNLLVELNREEEAGLAAAVDDYGRFMELPAALG